MTRRRRSIEVFTLSFLDCICCGFGAVILFYTIVSAQAGVRASHSTDPLSAEVNRLDEAVLHGSRGLVVLRNELQRRDSELAQAAARIRTVTASLRQQREQLATGAGTSLAQHADTADRKTDVRAFEEGTQRLEAGSVDRLPPGDQLSRFRDSGGDRRYLTGIRMQGRRILILLDVSASMLHEDLVSILRLRNEDDDHKRAAAKWRRAVDTVSWLTTQIPAASRFQLYTFNTRAQALLPDYAGKWLDAGDAPQRARVLASLQAVVPADGTSLYNAFMATRTLVPLPDQIILITDGLPTQGRSAGAEKYVDSDARMRLFDQAVGQLPAHVPVDCILLPMQGDLQAAHRFWSLARATDGVLIMPSKDWP
ncbi:MAG TPA: vWA domain-containing protein [Steroidobacteraceae bacterium]